MIFLLDCAIRSSVILGLAFLSLRLLRSQSAAVRHSILSVAIAGAAAMPALQSIVPSWDVAVRSEPAESIQPVIAPPADHPPDYLIEEFAAPVSPRETASAAPYLPRPAIINSENVVTVLWTAGALLGFGILLLRSHRLARIAARATPVRKGRWPQFASEISSTYGLRRKLRLLETSHPSVLATWGVLRPDVLLPASAQDWSDERVRVVLSHELAHVRRCDWLVQIAAELLRAVYWFNPLFWIACNRLRQESEQACDDAALNLGISNSEYAEHLLDLARTLQERASSWTLVSSMGRPSTLEKRFRALLNPRLDRRAVTRLSIAATATILLAITMPVAAFRATVRTTLPETSPATSPATPPAPAQSAAPAAGISIPQPANSGAAPTLPQHQPSADTARVEGVVVKAGTGEAIAGATVELQRAAPGPGPGGPAQPLSATTGADGRYLFQNVPPADYRLVATRAAGFVLAEYGQRSPSGRGLIMTLAAGQRFTDGRLAMTPTGSISGRIVDRDGEPVGRAQVQALQPAYRGGRKYLNILQSVQTNDLGEYRLFWLSPGPYYISARAEDVKRRQAPVFVSLPGAGGTFEQSSAPVISRRVLDNGEIVEEASMLVYYPGTIDAPSASPVEVRPGENSRGADFAISAGQIRARHVRGKVINGLTGQPSRATVQIVPRMFSPNAAIPSGSADQNGFFEIPGVVPGSYYLNASTAGAPGANNAASGLAFIEVGDADLDNITVVATAGFTISGRVVIEGRPAMQNDPDLVRLRVGMNRDPNNLGLPVILPGAVGGAPPNGAVSADGSFTMRNIGPGDYRANVAPLPPSLYIKSIRLDGVDLLAGILRLEKAPEGALEIVLGSTPGTLDGRVVNDKGQPSANVRVALIPDPPYRQRIDMYMSATADATGRFRFQGITPGNYKVFSWEDAPNNAWQDAEFLRTHEGRGKPVHIGDGGRETAEVMTIAPAPR